MVLFKYYYKDETDLQLIHLLPQAHIIVAYVAQKIILRSYLLIKSACKYSILEGRVEEF